MIVRSKPDVRFERRGEHLWRVETLEVTDAVLGMNLTVPTLDGHASVKVPAGTQPDAVLRLRGKRLPRFGGNGVGDLFVRIQLHVPEQLSPEERKLYEQLWALLRKHTQPTR